MLTIFSGVVRMDSTTLATLIASRAAFPQDNDSHSPLEHPVSVPMELFQTNGYIVPNNPSKVIR